MTPDDRARSATASFEEPASTVNAPRTPLAPESNYRRAERARLGDRLREPVGYDACGIICSVRKTGTPTHGNVKRAVQALTQMAHRSGEVRGEGDGCGVMTDIPRRLWRDHLSGAGIDPGLVDNPAFFVGHYFVPRNVNPREVLDHLRVHGGKFGVRVLLERRGTTHANALGPMAALAEPVFYQVAGTVSGEDDAERGRNLFELALELEAGTPVHVVSQSTHTVVYKVRGSAESLDRYYPELRRPEYESAVTIGHNRYSTNTLSTFEQVQPFSLLGHNGEINTIERLRREGAHLGVPLTGGSDSQDLNRVLEALLHRHGLSLFEALELMFPPVLGEVKAFSPALQDLYVGFRQAFGPLAQGPAALVTRLGNECAFSVDALGLRPLWFGETEKEYFWSSERGVLPFGALASDPRPLAPGEKMVVSVRPGSVQPVAHHEAQRLTLERAHNRAAVAPGARRHLPGSELPESGPTALPEAPAPALLAAYGWEKWDETYVGALCEKGAEPISSLGYDGPLAALRRPAPNLAEFLKETVAVVTNPAIDREREIEHFSTRAVLGRRALPDGSAAGSVVELLTPVLAPASFTARPGTASRAMLEAALVARTVPAGVSPDAGLADGLRAYRAAVRGAALSGAELIVLDDDVLAAGLLPLDPALAVAEAEHALAAPGEGKVSLRRGTSLLVASGALRNLHDLVVCLGLGADAVEPRLMFAAFARDAASAEKLQDALSKGIEKVLSTMGIHELRGYGRIFSALGLKPDLAARLGLRSMLAGDEGGFGLAELEASMRERAAAFQAGTTVPARDARFNTRAYKSAFAAANGEIAHSDYTARIRSLEYEFPVAARHLLEVKGLEGPSSPEEQELASEVDIGVGGHSLPFVISAMSFGSQGETAFRAYPEAARTLNMVSMNGEGGEIADLMGKYGRWRGQQVASGRFGVSSEMLNSCAFIEIKIGQGAKPGEGGHLPGSKVTSKVAAARHATPGVDLISPSNNHDLYSIEDLAQLVEELKTVNPHAKVCVKVPVVPSIGTIAVGIAKAGADVITLSGFEGGTGAARAHALKYAGLPAELGLRRAHRALVSAGIRNQVELWVDGGMKTALDVIKMVCLGADRVGFGTMAMAAIGCTICRGCQLDTCHVGIATQIEDEHEATQRGLKRFVPRVYEPSVEALVRYFT
ncbi:MAG TPA: glutamate synthase-related protein, partial [Deinococcales bacterium]|nr:glutamate synthase-related protein [Deinococcales bacterium]